MVVVVFEVLVLSGGGEVMTVVVFAVAVLVVLGAVSVNVVVAVSAMIVGIEAVVVGASLSLRLCGVSFQV